MSKHDRDNPPPEAVAHSIGYGVPGVPGVPTRPSRPAAKARRRGYVPPPPLPAKVPLVFAPCKHGGDWAYYCSPCVGCAAVRAWRRANR